jgi:MarR family transcriptional regulator for hemolysin
MTKLPSLPYDPSESITYWILNTAHRLEHLLNEELRPLDMTLRQAEVLVVLAVHGELSQVELARRLGVEPPTLAGIVARMEDSGWIARGGCPNDRRKKLIRLTDRVVPIWSQMLERARAVRMQASRGLTAEQLRTLHELLDHVHENIVAALAAHDAPRATRRVRTPRPARTAAAAVGDGNGKANGKTHAGAKGKGNANGHGSPARRRAVPARRDD